MSAAHLVISSSVRYSSFNTKVLLKVLWRMEKLNISLYLISIIAAGDEDIQFPHVKELDLLLNHEMSDFRQIHSIFPNIDVLVLRSEYNGTSGLPFTTKEVFLAIPNLKKLTVRIWNCQSQFSSKEEFVALLEMLQDSRVELKFDSDVLTDTAVDRALNMLDSELIEQEKLLKMKERIFFSFTTRKLRTPKIICENAKQIHSMRYYIIDESLSLQDVFTKIGRFTQLEKLCLNFMTGFATSIYDNRIISEQKPFSNLVEFVFRCFYIQCKPLLLSLHVLFPNLTKLDVFTNVPFDSWSESLFQLRKLEKIDLSVETTKSGLNDLLKAIADGVFPRLKQLHLPNVIVSNDNSAVSDNDLATYFKQMVASNPSLKFNNVPKLLRPIYSELAK